MDYRVFYRKYRPKNFKELVGQDNIKQILINSIKNNKIAHAYIFTGPRGTGKTSTAKIFAKTLNCINNNNGISCDECEMCKTYNESADIIEIDAASNNGVEEIRSLRDSVKIAPYNSKYKVYIIDEVHMLSNSAWNAFLKTLEEPPSHVIFILATTEINKIPDTVKSRCQRFDFSKIPEKEMINHLSDICSKEKIKITEDALHEIAKLSNGCLRDALSYLDKISKFDTDITVELIENNFGILNDKNKEQLYNSIKKSNIDQINEQLDTISNTGITPIDFINDFVNYLLSKIINKEVKTYEEIELIRNIVNKLNSLILNFNSVINPFILIKVELITINYFPGNNLENIVIEEKNDNINDEVQEKEKNTNIKKEIEFNPKIKEEVKENLDNNKFDINERKKIRINNSFCEASKELKNLFQNNWKKLIEKLNIDNDYTILGYIESATPEVVSKTNVILSFNNDNDAILFNSNVDIIEQKYKKLYKTDYKFIALSKDEWAQEKKEFINNKNKKYVYINENEIIKEEKLELENIAEDIFGSDIIEFR